MPKKALPQVPRDIIDLVANAVNQGFHRIGNDNGDLFGPEHHLKLTEGVQALISTLHEQEKYNDRLDRLNAAEETLRGGLSPLAQQGLLPTPAQMNEYINWMIVLFLIIYYQGENEKARQNANRAKEPWTKERRRTPSRSAKAASITNALVDHLLPNYGRQAFGVYLALSANLHLLSKPAEKDKIKDQIAMEVARSLDKLPPLPSTDISLFPILVITYISVTNGVSGQTICERLGLGNLAPILKFDEKKLLREDETRVVIANPNGTDKDISNFIKKHLKSAGLYDASAHHEIGTIESMPDDGEGYLPTMMETADHQMPRKDDVIPELTAWTSGIRSGLSEGQSIRKKRHRGTFEEYGQDLPD